jgi:hypothetical protein
MVGIEFKMPVFSQSERFYLVTPPKSEAGQAGLLGTWSHLNYTT